MNKIISTWFLIFLLSACSTHSNLGPSEPISKADSSDLKSVTDCQTINEKIISSKQAIQHYKKTRRMNTTANILSGIATVLSLGTSKIDYVSNDDFDFKNVIKSYENKIKELEDLQSQYCESDNQE
ncbi:hypothetical protein PT286_08635 [Neisseriaceae bacterium ESL0693]|nr:hypothetical protein [Neisseriaceae bacterium ESL0693]